MSKGSEQPCLQEVKQTANEHMEIFNMIVTRENKSKPQWHTTLHLLACLNCKNKKNQKRCRNHNPHTHFLQECKYATLKRQLDSSLES